jgi:L-ascorbate metabolism protein UlaG (beta-lactamase superfamily)
MRKLFLVAISTAAALASLPLRADTLKAGGGDIEITPIIHASVQLEYAGKVIHVDPWSQGDYSRAKPADLILVTDDNSHHLDVTEIQKLRKPGGIVVSPGIGKPKLPDAMVMANGETKTIAGVTVEAIAMYDVKQGEPSHPKGRGNGYVITLGGKRLYFAGVTECVPEMQALKNIDVAFMPMNLPLGRMLPSAAADCVKTFKPKVVYPYHYDQDWVSRLTNSRGAQPPSAVTATDTSLQAFRDALKGEAIEVRGANWYPADRPSSR